MRQGSAPPVSRLLIAYGVIAWIRIRFLALPLGRNEGTYGYLGSLVLRGGVPFTDFYEMKPVGLYFTYSWFVGVFGGTPAGLHLGLLVLNVSTALFNAPSGVLSSWLKVAAKRL